MSEEGGYFVVLSGLGRAPLADFLMHGYVSRYAFVDALRRITARWKKRIGLCVGERNGFLLLRFCDTPGGVPDEEWIPRYLLRPAEPWEYAPFLEDGGGGADDGVDHVFGFD